TVLLAVTGCRLPSERDPLAPLPEGGEAFSYLELLRRARTQASMAVEAFYVDAWTDLDDAARSLEQTARFLPKTTQVPASLKDKLTPEAEQLRLDAQKLGEAARAKNAQGVNEA